MKTIKVYDINAFLLKENNVEAFHYKKAVIFQTNYGIVFAEPEAIHQCENIITDSVSINANTPTDANHIAIMPNKLCFVVLKDIIDKAPYEEMTVAEFFNRRDYNSRCRQNWSILKGSLKDIEFDLSEYLEVD